MIVYLFGMHVFFLDRFVATQHFMFWLFSFFGRIGMLYDSIIWYCQTIREVWLLFFFLMCLCWFVCERVAQKTWESNFDSDRYCKCSKQMVLHLEYLGITKSNLFIFDSVANMRLWFCVPSLQCDVRSVLLGREALFASSITIHWNTSGPATTIRFIRVNHNKMRIY